MDSNIQQLQLRLMHLGYNIDTATGEFDAETTSAIITFQRDFGLTADGVAGPKTQAAINKYAVVGANEPSTVGHLSRFLVTSYMAACESDSGSNKIIPVKDNNGHLIAMVDPHFFCNLAVEGTGKLDDGRVLNVTGKYIPTPPGVQNTLLITAKQMFGLHFKYGGVNDDASMYFAFTVLPAQYPWGTGVHGAALELWRSLAADLGSHSLNDPRFKGKGGLVPFGTKVYILELDGMMMPDGFIHDGWCRVDDTGSAINGAHFDWFVGKKSFMKQIHRFDILHIWFNGSEDRIPRNYTYGIK